KVFSASTSALMLPRRPSTSIRSSSQIVSSSSTGFCRGLSTSATRACAGSCSSSSRHSVVLPVPTSPVSWTKPPPPPLSIPNSRCARASRCPSPRCTKRGSGVIENGGSRRPKCDRYLGRRLARHVLGLGGGQDLDVLDPLRPDQQRVGQDHAEDDRHAAVERRGQLPLLAQQQHRQHDRVDRLQVHRELRGE